MEAWCKGRSPERAVESIGERQVCACVSVNENEDVTEFSNVNLLSLADFQSAIDGPMMVAHGLWGDGFLNETCFVPASQVALFIGSCGNAPSWMRYSAVADGVT